MLQSVVKKLLSFEVDIPPAHITFESGRKKYRVYNLSNHIKLSKVASTQIYSLKKEC